MRRDLFDGSRDRGDDHDRLTGAQRLERPQAGDHLILIFGSVPQQELLLSRQGKDLFVLHKKRKI